MGKITFLKKIGSGECGENGGWCQVIETGMREVHVYFLIDGCPGTNSSVSYDKTGTPRRR